MYAHLRSTVLWPGIFAFCKITKHAWEVWVYETRRLIVFEESSPILIFGNDRLQHYISCGVYSTWWIYMCTKNKGNRKGQIIMNGGLKRIEVASIWLQAPMLEELKRNKGDKKQRTCECKKMIIFLSLSWWSHTNNRRQRSIDPHIVPKSIVVDVHVDSEPTWTTENKNKPWTHE